MYDFSFWYGFNVIFRNTRCLTKWSWGISFFALPIWILWHLVAAYLIFCDPFWYKEQEVFLRLAPIFQFFCFVGKYVCFLSQFLDIPICSMTIFFSYVISQCQLIIFLNTQSICYTSLCAIRPSKRDSSSEFTW